MKIVRTAMHRREMDKVLLEEPQSETRPWLIPPKASIMRKRLDGRDRGNSYKYFIELPLDELIGALSAALDGRTTTPAERAIAASSLAAIKVLLGREDE